MRGRLRRVRRRLDLRLYRAMHAMVRAMVRPCAQRPAPEALRRVLIVRHDRIGDWVVTTPVIAMLRELAPKAEIDVLASRTNASLVRADERVARVLVRADGWRGWLALARTLRAARYDLVLSTIYGRGVREGLVAVLASRRGTYSASVFHPRRYHGFFSVVVRVPQSWRHMSERLLYVAQLAVSGSARPRAESVARWPMRLGSDAEAERYADDVLSTRDTVDCVAVNLSAAEPDRAWAPAACAATLGLLLAAHPALHFVLTPPPGKEASAEEVVRRCADARVVMAPPSDRLVDLVALLRRARVVITPDTANVHLASAAGRPVLGLYTAGPAPVLWAPRGVPYRIVLAPGRSVSDTEPAAIAAAFSELLRLAP